MWTQWYGGLEHAAHWSETLKHLELNDRLDFFEKLISGGTLTADEFCDFLLEKNEAVFLTLWNRVPEQQWATWFKDNPNLPATTVSLLNTMAYPLRVQFFKAMLKMTATEIASLCIVPNKTVEQFYPQDVASKVSSATTVSDAKAKLNKLKENKEQEFNDSVQQLIKGIEELNKHLNDMSKTNIKAHTGYQTYALSFFKTDPYYVVLRSIATSKSSINKLCEKISALPLLAMLKEQSEPIKGFAKLATAMEEFKKQLESLKAQATEMPSDLDREFKALELVLKKLEEIQPLPSQPEAANTLADEGSPTSLVL
jgi:hypothetical protein